MGGKGSPAAARPRNARRSIGADHIAGRLAAAIKSG